MSRSEEGGEDPVGVSEFECEFELGLFFGVEGEAVRPQIFDE